MPHNNNPSINSVYTMTLITKSRKNILNDFRKLQELAIDIKQMYELLDKRHHELTYVTMNMEKHFGELFKLVFGCLPARDEFKKTIEKICEERELVEKTRSQTFFYG